MPSTIVSSLPSPLSYTIEYEDSKSRALGSYECELELHEALKLPLPIPDVLEFIRWVARARALSTCSLKNRNGEAIFKAGLANY